MITHVRSSMYTQTEVRCKKLKKENMHFHMHDTYNYTNMDYWLNASNIFAVTLVPKPLYHNLIFQVFFLALFILIKYL